MKVWLDDERPAPKGWVHVKTADEAIHLLESMRSALARDDEYLMTFALDGSVHARPVYSKEYWTITHMSFDHDLADVHYTYFLAGQVLPKDHPQREFCKAEAAKEMTGYEVILWMAEHEVWPTVECRVHTHNSVRGPIMADMINRYGPYENKVRWTPYSV